MTSKLFTAIGSFFVGLSTTGFSISHAQPADGKPGGEVRLAVDTGPLGATGQYEVQPVGAADVFGNGPYDLLVSDHQLLPFKSFTPAGVPVYGQPLTYKSPSGTLALFTKNSLPYAAVYESGRLRLARLNKQSLVFELVEGFSVEVPTGLGTLAAYSLPHDQLAILYTKGDGKSKGVPDANSHAAEFRPFDGSGIWRGKLSYSVLGSMILGQDKSVPEINFPIFAAQRDFLIRCTGLTTVDYPSASQQGVIGAASQGMFYYFKNDSEGGLQLQPGVFLSDADGNGLQHPGIFPRPVAIPDAKTGDSDLLVGDTGSLWFYNFTGRFNIRGGPIYDPPVQALIEAPVLSLGALPVLTSGDLDGDGLVDMVAGNDAGHFLFIRNIGTKNKAEFDSPVRIKAGGEILKIDGGYIGIQGPPESRWGYTCPTLFDWNGDGLQDIIFNSILGEVSVMLHEPGSHPPAFKLPVVLKSDTMEMHLVWRTQPAVTNWGIKDGRNCIVVNDENNQFRRFWQVDDYNVTPGEVLRLTTGEPIQAHSKRFAGQWGRTKLQAIDWDGDGAIDLLAGTGRAASIPGPGGIPDDTFVDDRRQASVLFLRNAGSNENPVFEYPLVMHYDNQKLEMGTHTCTPLAIDWGRGKLDLFVGEEDGTVIYYPRESLTWVDVRGQTTPYPNCVKIFNGSDFEGWQADSSTWSIVDGAMRGAGGSSRLTYTNKDYGNFRLIFKSRMDEVNGDHLGLMFWGDRPADPAKPKTDSAGWLQFAPPIGWMWDYHPPKGHTPKFERLAEGSMDFTNWTTTEMLCNLDQGTMRAAVDGVELARYVHFYPEERTDPERRIVPGPIAMMRHGGGTSLYKDIYVEENPVEDKLLTVTASR